MNKSLSQAARSRHTGFTLVELLVVIAIIGMLMALLIPAVNAARARARQGVCSNQLKQLGIAVINYESSKGKFPGYMQPLRRNSSDPQQYLLINIAQLSSSRFDSTDNPDLSRVSWAAVLAPQIDKQDFYDAMVDHNVRPGGSFEAQALIRPVEVLTCPSDTDLLSQPGNAGMSYVANSGTWDWYTPSGGIPTTFDRASFTAIRGDDKANGIFHNKTLGPFTMRSSDISDGLSNTLLITENIHKELEDPNVGLCTWAGVNGVSPGEQQLGMVWLEPGANTPFTDPDGDYQNPASEPQQFPFSVEGDTQSFYDNRPTYARPASSHPGGAINAVMAGGEVKTLGADMDYDVYQRLLTPEGRKCVEPINHAASVYQRLPLLSESDF